MKNLFFYSSLFMATAAFTACGNSAETDSKKIADSTNSAKIDSARTADTVTTPTGHLAEMKTDAEFAVAAADGGMLEVALGKLAVARGKSTQVKSLGAMMVKDHSAANKELIALAKEKNITLPETMSEKCQKAVSDLKEKTGSDFDKAYAELMVSDHKDDIDEFKKEAEKGKDAAVSAWAAKKVPVLEHHLAMAENTEKMTKDK